MGWFDDLTGWTDSKTSTASSSSTTKKDYTPEQTEYRKSVLGSASPLMTQISQILSQGLNSGSLMPTELEQQIYSQGLNRINNQYDALKQSASESLAGRGRLDSGITTKVMKDIASNQAGAIEDYTTEQNKAQYDNYMDLISTALGYGSIGTSLMSPIGSTQQGNSSNTMSDIEASAKIIQAIFG